jgi:hypothetical protein
VVALQQEENTKAINKIKHLYRIKHCGRGVVYNLYIRIFLERITAFGIGDGRTNRKPKRAFLFI